MKKKIYAGFVLDDVSPEEAVNAALTGADGIVMTDVSEDDEEHDAFMGGIRELARRVEAPLISGGRVKRLEDVKKYLYAGSSGVYLDAAEESNLELLKEAADRFGGSKIWICISSPEQSGKVREVLTGDIAGLIVNTEAADSSFFDEWADFPGDILLTSPEDPEAAARTLELPCSGALILNDSPDQIDYMELKTGLRKKGIGTEILAPAFSWDDIKKDPQGLLPVVVQDYKTLDVLMVAWMNEEAYLKTLETGRMTYWSRSRQSLWLKGETSGHFQFVKSLTLDCDKDTLLAKVFQVGAACHTGSWSCFFNTVAEKPESHKNPHRIFEDVYQVILDRKEHPKEGSYTNYLFDKGIDKILKKVGEEATEIVIAAKNPDAEELKYEICDFLYHVMVLMAEKGVTWEDVTQELANR
ncbi:MAG: bifunctional phosphoribosyl-AMP cyclohydrolase/phosphoribosyl-ATP diphosphatase HisIE [Stomatobaculum sp.]|nr:bifunctional phosphoribosyl-AMP cyclohydrolase/phosphoribosyl-ATP diphosphatase HisIE [Stomatobaculum sp.]